MKKSFSITLILMLFSALYVYSQQAIITYLKGKVEIYSNNQWKRAAVRMMLTGREKIRTGRNAMCNLIFEQGHELMVSQNTIIELEELTNNSTSLVIQSGKIRSKVKKLSKLQRYAVRTPTGLCSVRGTDFAVEFIDNKMKVEVYEGLVAAQEEVTGSEVLINAGEYSVIEYNKPPTKPESIKIQETGITDEQLRNQIRLESQQEIFNEISREEVMARAADEIRAAEYYEGKTAIDASGNRVRMESYIVRDVPTLLDTQFKYVNLNTREDRFDFGKILFTFDKPLPQDLSVVTRDMLFSFEPVKPNWILKEMESVMSNTYDKVIEEAYDGDMVGNPGYWEHQFANYKFYVGNKNSTENGGKGLLRWETVNGTPYYYFYNNGEQQTQSAPGQSIEYPSGPDKMHVRYKDIYNDGFILQADDYIINDEGKIQSASDFSGLTYDEWKTKIYGLNFERVLYSESFGGKDKKIDLVTSGKIYEWLGWLK